MMAEHALKYRHVCTPGGHHQSITLSFSFREPGETETAAREKLEDRLAALEAPGEWVAVEEPGGAVDRLTVIERKVYVCPLHGETGHTVGMGQGRPPICSDCGQPVKVIRLVPDDQLAGAVQDVRDALRLGEWEGVEMTREDLTRWADLKAKYADPTTTGGQ